MTERTNYRDELLACLLECRPADISILKYFQDGDFIDIIANIDDCGEKPTLERIVKNIFYDGMYELECIVTEKYDVLVERNDEGEIGLREKIFELQNLSVFNDIEPYFNYLDTHIRFINNEDIYRKYFAKEISEIEDKIGFEFE